MKHTSSHPPRLFLRFFRWFCHPMMRDYIEGDLIEVYERRLKEFGKRKADLRFVIDVLLLLRPGIIKSWRYNDLTHWSMIRIYFKIGWRTILRQRLYSFINISGLALGICACVAIYTISKYELSFDTFHNDKERIYRVLGDVKENTGGTLTFCRLPIPLLHHARSLSSGMEAVAGCIPYGAKINVRSGESLVEFEGRKGGTHFITTAIVDPAYFEIFRYQWLKGSADRALTEPLSVVLTESRAREYFGPIQLDEIIGKQVIYNDSLIVKVTGILKDWNANTDFPFTDFISYSSLHSRFLSKTINTDSWRQNDMSCWIFMKLTKKNEPRAIEGLLGKIARSYAGDLDLTPRLESLSDIHFDANVIENPIRTAHLPTLFSLIGIAILILLLAIINFVNLATAQSIQRAKEVAVKKILGSGRINLSLQFLVETFLLTVLGAVLAIILVDPVLTIFESFIPAGVSFQLLDLSTVLFLVALILAITALSGIYPSFILSSYRPVLSLKGTGLTPGSERWFLRKGLMVFQFSVSLVFIIGSIVISEQLNYTRKKDLGFVADEIVLIDTPWDQPLQKIERLAERVKLVENVKEVALQWVSPMVLNGRARAIKFNSTDEKEIEVVQVAGNEDFIPLYQIKLLAGRNLAPADSLKEFVINENLSRRMGCKAPDDAIGKMLYWDDKPYPVVGVVQDFHTRSLHESILPVCIVNRPDRQRTLAVRLSSSKMTVDAVSATLQKIQEHWEGLYPEGTFRATFYNESLQQIYESDRRAETLVNAAMIVTMIISSIGLFGLTLFTSEKKLKEISIRKILGASVAGIVILLGRGFLPLLGIALLVSSPVAVYFLNQWLEGFAYHVAISWSAFVWASLYCLLVMSVSVGYQSIKAALVNPARNLKSE